MQHIREEEGMEHDAVVWDAAPPMQPPGSLPPTDTTEPTDQSDAVEDSVNDTEEVSTQPFYMEVTPIHMSAPKPAAQILRQGS